MSELVQPDLIEKIVGAKRCDDEHLVRADSSFKRVFILHSKQCKETTTDLRDCEYSLALDLGIDLWMWQAFQDVPVLASISQAHGDLVPVRVVD